MQAKFGPPGQSFTPMVYIIRANLYQVSKLLLSYLKPFTSPDTQAHLKTTKRWLHFDLIENRMLGKVGQ